MVDGEDVYGISLRRDLPLEFLVGVPSVVQEVAVQRLQVFSAPVAPALELALLAVADPPAPPVDMLEVSQDVRDRPRAPC